LKETGRLEGRKLLFTHERRGIGTDTNRISFVKRGGLIEGQEIHDFV
jgi:hypothetical protein